MKLRPAPGTRSYVLAKSAVGLVNTPIAKRRGARVFAESVRPVQLEIGGTAERAGWVVTNVSATARHFLDATGPWPFEDGALSYVYSDNVIEHVTLEQGRAMMAEAYRCLRPGGVIRMVTPDLGQHIDLYRAGDAALSSPVAESYRAMGLTVAHPIDLVRIPIASFEHHVGYLYDFPTLAAELEAVGFRDAVRHDPGESSHEALRDLDQRTHEGSAQMAVEATRP